MPTIDELPLAQGTGPGDELPISQGGVTRAVTTAQLFAGLQQGITLPTGRLLGRVSAGPGGPEQVNVGAGLGFLTGALIANGGDHANFPPRTQLTQTDNLVVNASGVPMQMPVPLMRGLFSGGANIAIGNRGAISASTDPAVTAQLGTLGTQLSAAQASLAALSAEIPPGGVAGLNSQGQMINPVAADVGAGTVQSAGAAIARTLGAKASDTLNLLDFGAVSGGPDCTPALVAAFAAAPGSGGEILVPEGDYWFASAAPLSGKGVVIRGAGKGHTRLHISHAGFGIDISPGSLYNRAVVRDLSVYAENKTGPCAGAVRISFPAGQSGYVLAQVFEVECFGYPNQANGNAPYPQTFLRGVVLQGCWSSELRNLSFFGPPATAGATSVAAVEINQSYDTRIHGLQVYYGNTAVLQSGYAEGIYLINPLVVGADYVVRQTDQTKWQGYQPNKPMLLGLWVLGGELNTNLGCLQLANVTIGFVVGCDVSRNGGPNTAQTSMDFTNVSNFYFQGCNFVGGPTGGGGFDTAFSFKSTWNSSNNILSACHFEDLTTAIYIAPPNGTVGLVTYGLQFGNVAIATAIVDKSNIQASNHVNFVAPAIGTTIAAGLGKTQDHVLNNAAGQVLFQVNATANAANYLRVQPGSAGNAPAFSFEGGDATVGGVIATKGGSLVFNANGGNQASGNVLTLSTVAGGTNSVTLQNASGASACLLSTSAGGLTVQPKGALTLASGTGLFLPGLPTSKPPSGSGQVWNNNGVLSIA